MKKETRALYNSTAAREMQFLCELIDSVFDEYQIARRSTMPYAEIGFYRSDKVSKSSIFFGIWFESWITFQVPLCIAVDYQGIAPVEKHLQIKKFIEGRNDKALQFKDFSGWAVVLIGFEFLRFDDSDTERLGDLLDAVQKIAEIKV